MQFKLNHISIFKAKLAVSWSSDEWNHCMTLIYVNGTEQSWIMHMKSWSWIIKNVLALEIMVRGCSVSSTVFSLPICFCYSSKCIKFCWKSQRSNNLQFVIHFEMLFLTQLPRFSCKHICIFPPTLNLLIDFNYFATETSLWWLSQRCFNTNVHNVCWIKCQIVKRWPLSQVERY